MKDLTLKQKRFVKEYLKDGNGTRAAFKVYKVKNANTAHAVASETLRSPTVIKAIKMKLRMEDVDERFIIERLIKETDDENAAVRLKALELLGKYLKLFTDKVDHSHVFDKVKEIGWGSFDEASEQPAE